MFAWIVQWYRKVPRWPNLRVNDAPGANVRSHNPVFEVVVWVRVPLLTHRTLMPRAIVIDPGWKALSTIRTRTRDPPLAWSPGASAPAAGASATNATTRTTQVMSERFTGIPPERSGPVAHRNPGSLKRCPCCPTVGPTAPHLRFPRRRSAIRLEERETAQADEKGAVRSLYGIDGPRRRPTPVAIDAEAVVVLPNDARPEAIDLDVPRTAALVEPDVLETQAIRPASEHDAADVGDEHSAETAAEAPSVQDLWRGESDERARSLRTASDLAEMERRFDTLRIELEAALDRRIRVAVDQMQTTFDKEKIGRAHV